MSYRPEDPTGDGGELDPQAIFERFRAITEPFFAGDSKADWVMVGANSGLIVDSGVDAAIIPRPVKAELEVYLGENLIVFGRPMSVEPNHPNPSVPPAR